jgi:hypothetical protein
MLTTEFWVAHALGVALKVIGLGANPKRPSRLCWPRKGEAT